MPALFELSFSPQPGWYESINTRFCCCSGCCCCYQTHLSPCPAQPMLAAAQGGRVASLTIIPQPGWYEFIKTWFGGCSGGNSSCSCCGSDLRSCCSQLGRGAGMRPLACTMPPWFCRRRPDSCGVQSARAVEQQHEMSKNMVQNQSKRILLCVVNCKCALHFGMPARIQSLSPWVYFPAFAVCTSRLVYSLDMLHTVPVLSLS
jgi:hypothetical protein